MKDSTQKLCSQKVNLLSYKDKNSNCGWKKVEYLIGTFLQLFFNVKDYLYISILECSRGTSPPTVDLKSKSQYWTSALLSNIQAISGVVFFQKEKLKFNSAANKQWKM